MNNLLLMLLFSFFFLSCGYSHYNLKAFKDGKDYTLGECYKQNGYSFSNNDSFKFHDNNGDYDNVYSRSDSIVDKCSKKLMDLEKKIYQLENPLNPLDTNTQFNKLGSDSNFNNKFDYN